MAGDWIKLQKDTFDKPEVLAIATRMGIDPDAVVGKLGRIWSWFDTHTVDGNASCVTFSFIDRYVGVSGFAEQVALVGWLVQNGHDLTLPNFDYHNGETAKTRALTKNRVEKHRSNANGNASGNGNGVTKSLPEKRREEKINTYSAHVQSVIDLYHSALPELPTVRLLPKKRKEAIGKFIDFVLTSKKTDGTQRATNEAEALEWIDAYFHRVRDNNFLMGKIGRVGEHSGWQCDLDYLLTDKGMTQVIEKTREAA